MKLHRLEDHGGAGKSLPKTALFPRIFNLQKTEAQTLQWEIH